MCSLLHSSLALRIMLIVHCEIGHSGSQIRPRHPSVGDFWAMVFYLPNNVCANNQNYIMCIWCWNLDYLWVTRCELKIHLRHQKRWYLRLKCTESFQRKFFDFCLKHLFESATVLKLFTMDPIRVHLVQNSDTFWKRYVTFSQCHNQIVYENKFRTLVIPKIRKSWS